MIPFKPSFILSLALALTPLAALAQAAPPPPPDAGPQSAGQRAMREQMHTQFEQLQVQNRSRMLAALTPQHRTAVANIVGQLTLSANPNLQGAAQALDAILSPAEKQSVVNIETAQRNSVHALMEQHRAAFEATLSADQRAKMDQHVAKMEAFRQSHALPPQANDPGAIVLRTLGSFGGPGMHGHMF